MTTTELHELLRRELIDRMEAAGWTVDAAFDTEPGSFMIAAFRAPVADDFWVTAEFSRTSLGRPDDKPFVVLPTVGVSYGPAYRLWPVVSDCERSELTIGVGDLLGLTEDPEVELSAPAGVANAAELLTALVVEDGPTWAAQYATVEALLEANRGSSAWFAWEIEVVPLLLAAAGRHDEARAALAAYESSGRSEVRENGYRRFAYQLTRWLDDGAQLPDPPTGPVGVPIRVRPTTVSLKDAWREARARQEAVRAVRLAGAGRDRGELRGLLTAELERRGVTDSPLELETQLDSLQAPDDPGSRVLGTVRAATALAHLGKRMRQVMREAPSPTPEWLEPPAHALFPARTGHGWIAVHAEPEAGPVLDRVLTTSPDAGRTVLVDAWLAWGPAPPAPGSQLSVHIGEFPVGTLAPEQAALYRPDMEAAAVRHELPYLLARLTRLRPPDDYLLEVRSPCDDHA